MAVFTRRRRPRPLAWALLSLLIAVSLVPDLAAADVMPPTGLVVKRSMSLDSAEATVEWCSPRCVDSVVDVLYSFKVSVYDATTSELVSTAETNTGQNGLKCQLDWHARSPAQHRITGLTAYRDYVVRVQSRVHGEQNGPLSDLIESPEIVLRAGVMPRGSGREQVERSGLQTSIRKTHVYYSSSTSSSVDGMGLFPTEELGSEWGGMRHVGSIAFDPDGDGDLDLFIIGGDTCQASTYGNTCSEYPNVFLENNGSGWFHVHGHFETDEPHPLPDTRYDSRAAVAGDFNGDGYLDLFVANYDDVNELLLNDGTTGKQFVPSTNAGDAVTTTEKSMGVVAGDFDLDGDLDLFVVNYDSKNELFWNDGAGSFTLDDNPDSPLTNEVTYSWTVIAADFNGDGYLDIFEVCSTSFSSSMPNHDTTNRLYMSDGSGGFTLSSDPEAMGPDDVETRGAVARDFNNDGIIDLYYVNKFQSDTNKLLINDGSGSFTAVGGIDATGKLSSSTSVTSCDIDGDGDQVLLVFGGPSFIALNDGTGNFSELGGDKQVVGYAGTCFHATKDSQMSIWASSGGANPYDSGSGQPSYYMPDGSWPIELHSGGGDATSNREATNCMIPVDVDGDGDMDLIVCTRAGSPNKLLINDGTGNFNNLEGAFGDPSSDDHPYTYSATLLDANGDGHIDVFFVNQGQQGSVLYFGTAQGNFEIGVAENEDLFGEGYLAGAYAVAADFNGDGLVDLYLAIHHIYTKNALYLNEGIPASGSMRYRNISFTKKEDLVQRPDGASRAAVAVDVDSDGDMDLFVVDYDSTCVLYINDGDAGFTFQSADGQAGVSEFTDTESTWVDVVAADFNGDGSMDLLVAANDINPNALFLNAGDGTFLEVNQGDHGLPSGSSIPGYRLAAVDIDQDGDVDVVGIGWNTVPAKNHLYINDGSAHFHQVDLGWDTESQEALGIATADFDGDGDIDFFYYTGSSYTDKLYLVCGTGYSLLPGTGLCAAPSRRPEVKLVTPLSSPTRGQGLAIIQGNLGMDPAGSVEIGGRPCHVSSYVSRAMWICVVPPGAGKMLQVVAKNYGHTSLASNVLFHYRAPQITGVHPRIFYVHDDFHNDPSNGIYFDIHGEDLGPPGTARTVTVAGAGCTIQGSGDHELFRCHVSPFEEGWNETFLDDGVHSVEITVAGQLISLTKVCRATNENSAFCRCPPGTEYNIDGGDFDTSECRPCNANHYSDGHLCVACPLGGFTDPSPDAELPTSVTDCLCPTNSKQVYEVGLNPITQAFEPYVRACQCKEGYGGDATTLVLCTQCGNSAYKDEVGNVQCTACPAGSSIAGENQAATDIGECVCQEHAEMNVEMGRCECLPGYGGDASNTAVGCSPCGQRAYKSERGNSQCTPCPAGSAIHNGITNSTYKDRCVCPFNSRMETATYNGQVLERCECEAGYGGDATSPNVQCTPCKTSTGWKNYNANTPCTQCPPGSIIDPDVEVAIFETSCMCGLNAELNADTGRCECSAGYGGDATYPSIGCSACGTASYKSDVGNTQCTSCPAGSSIADESTNATSSDSCACGLNAELNADTGRCECSAGYGGDATNPSIGCSACGTTSYKSDVGNTQCTTCPAGASIAGGGMNATSSDSCACGLNAELNAELGRCECSAGYRGDASIAVIGCFPCGSTSYKPLPGNTACISCPSGASISGRNAVSASSCQCPQHSESVSVWSEFEENESQSCACVPGYGGDATNPSVGCSACGSFAFKANHVNEACTPCPSGASILSGVVNATNSDSCQCGANTVLNDEDGICECMAGHGGDATKGNIGCSVCGVNGYKAETGNRDCNPCPAGSAIQEGVTAVSVEECSCAEGTVVVGDGSDTSTIMCECAVGYFGSSAGATGCQMCPLGDYKDLAGNAVSCSSCEVALGEGATTFERGAQSVDMCECGSGFYKFEESCVPCETGAYCPGGDASSMVALPGYWRSNPASTAFFSCESPNGYTLCMGGTANQTGVGQSGPLCREGHEGLLCSKCKKGYGKTYGVCSKCDSAFNASGVLLVLFAILVFLALLYLLISNNLRKATSQSNEKESITLSVVKIIINWLQMASIAAQVRVSSNESMERFFQIQDVSNVSPFQFSSFNCMVQANYFDQFYSALAVPPMCVALGFCLTGVHFLARRAKSVRFRDMFVKVSQMLWFFTYSMVSQIILGIFECRDLDRGISVLSADLAVQCETSKHNSAVSLGYIFGALYIAGLPIQVVAQLYWYRNNLQDQSIKVRYMFLFHNYREGLYWYECVNMLRKIGLVTALVLLQEDLGTQVFALSILSMTYLTLHAYIKPYSSRTLNELETGALFVTALTLSTCSFFYSNPTGTGNPVVENGLTWSVILLSTALLLWSIFLIGKRGLVAMATRGKQGNGLYDLPSKASRPHLNGKNGGGDCAGSPSQFKSLLAHDETAAATSPVPTPEATKVTVMSNPLRQQGAAREPQGAPLPTTISKGWKERGRERVVTVSNPLSAKPPEGEEERGSDNPLCAAGDGEGMAEDLPDSIVHGTMSVGVKEDSEAPLVTNPLSDKSEESALYPVIAHE